MKMKKFQLMSFIAILALTSTLPSISNAVPNDICKIVGFAGGYTQGKDSRLSVLGQHSLDINSYKENPLYKAALDGINQVLANSNGLPDDILLSDAFQIVGGSIKATQSGIDKIRNLIPQISANVAKAAQELKQQGDLSKYQFSYNASFGLGYVSNLNYDGSIGNCDDKNSEKPFNLEMDPNRIKEMTVEENILENDNELKTINGIISKSQIAAIVLNLSSAKKTNAIQMDMDLVIALPKNFRIDVSKYDTEVVFEDGFQPMVLDESLGLNAQKFSIKNTVANPVSYLHLKIKGLTFDIRKATEKEIKEGSGIFVTQLQYPTIEVHFSNQVTIQTNAKSIDINSKTNTAGVLEISTDLGNSVYPDGLRLGIDQILVKFNKRFRKFPDILAPQLEWPESDYMNWFSSRQTGIGPMVSDKYIGKTYRFTLNNLPKENSKQFGLANTNKQIADQARGAETALKMVYDIVSGFINIQNDPNSSDSTESSKQIKLFDKALESK